MRVSLAVKRAVLAACWLRLRWEQQHASSTGHSAAPPSPIHPHPRRYQGHVSAALVLGGVDFRGPHLFTVYPHGSTDSLPYCTMGSGRWAV